MLRRLLIVGILLALAVSGAAQQTTSVTIPRYTVVPVTATSALNSASANRGDCFTAVSTAVPSCSLPAGTIFSGQVTRVMRGRGRTPGRIAVHFDRAQLPDGTCIGVNGVLAIMDTEPSCPAMCPQCPTVSREWSDARNEFIAGPNCAVYVGVLCRGNVIVGSQSLSLAAICGPGTTVKAAGGQDVVIACGTQFGIMLRDPICIPIACPPTSPPTGAGPCPLNISFGAGQPFMFNQSVMVPLAAVMNATGTTYELDQNTNILTFNTSQGRVTHRIGTDVINVNGQDKQLSGYSGIMNNVIYIPTDAISTAGGANVTWDADRSMLRIQ